MTVSGKINIEQSATTARIRHNTIEAFHVEGLPPVIGTATGIQIVVRNTVNGWQAADFVDHNGHKCLTVLFNGPHAPRSVPQCPYCGGSHADKPAAKACEDAAFDDMLQYAYNG